jgi:ubiquinone/menaquinone biosynthesis C-methylase UbiE
MKTCHDYFYNKEGNRIVKYLGRTDYINHDLDLILKEIGITTDLKTPHINKSDHKNRDHYFKDKLIINYLNKKDERDIKIYQLIEEEMNKLQMKNQKSNLKMQDKRVSIVDWEKDIYAKGQQLNHWPYTDVVSDVIRLTKGRDRKKLRILEIGCGACNNLWFAAEVGFQISGLDISKSAIEYGESRLEKLGFEQADLRVGDITKLPWEDDYFDIVLDRGALTQNNYQRISKSLEEVRRILKKDGGIMLSYTLFGLNTTAIKYAKEVSKNTYDFFTESKFASVGLTSFFGKSDIEELFSEFSSLIISKKSSEDLQTRDIRETYSVIAKQ